MLSGQGLRPSRKRCAGTQRYPFFLGLLLSTAALQFLPPKRALRVHGFRFPDYFLEAKSEKPKVAWPKILEFLLN